MTSRRTVLSSWTLACTLLLSCGSRPDGVPAIARVPAGAVAVVGDDSIDAATVLHIATAQQVAAKVAADRAVSDALVAADAKRRYGEASVRQARRGALARTLLEGFANEARRRGAPTDDEVARETQKRWWELDRPRLLRTTHAVVLVKNPGDETRARIVIGRIADRVSGISNPAAFKARVAGVPSDGLEVRIVDVDAPQLKAPGSALLPAYADAAFAIPAVGRTSPVVHTSYGYHVILAVESIPEHRVPLEERRTRLAVDVVNARATALYDAALAHARSLDAVVYERSAVDTMLQVQTAR
jgi:hypothetical protein